jgi:biopolymer transport protein ExbB
MISSFFEQISDFLAAGGDVLTVIFFATFVLWFFIIERFIFFKKRFPILLSEQEQTWQERSDKSSWKAHRIRDYMISKSSQEVFRFIPFIKMLVNTAPLLGLLGTVTGMIAVFDVMALTGTGNARLMASGISMATIPTMAGMVTALSGLYFGSLFERKAKESMVKLSDAMELQL